MDTLAREYNIHEAKTHLSKILERVEHGEEVLINRAGQPVAKIVPLPPTVNRTSRGTFRGRIRYADDWDSEETNNAIAEEWGF